MNAKLSKHRSPHSRRNSRHNVSYLKGHPPSAHRSLVPKMDNSDEAWKESFLTGYTVDPKIAAAVAMF